MTARAYLSAALLLLAGCNFGNWRWLDHDGHDQVLRVQSGDRYFFSYAEDVAAGCRWEVTCADDDVEIALAHVGPDPDEPAGALGKAKGEIRIHRGFDGPAEVKFRYWRPSKTTAEKEFSISLFKETGDRAFWE